MKYELENKTSKVGERGQVTIPKSFRARYGVKPGGEVVFHEHEDGLLIKKSPRGNPLRALLGRVKNKMDVDDYLDRSRGPAWTAELDKP